MSPGGHLVTTVGACAAAAVLTHTLPPAESLALTASVALGGFCIDVDHMIDYVVFDGQRDLRPQAFLRYYLTGRMQRTILLLHSYELFTILGLLAYWTDALVLWGYLGGALMHLALDLVFNGELAPRRIVPFYSFLYRMAHGFDARALLGLPGSLRAPDRFWPAFFAGARLPETSTAARPPLPVQLGVTLLPPHTERES